ncbi:hypothetical protein J2S41_001669 [Catenuloplanes atrovinosus]|uniref:Transcriptional regulator SbtR-like C-terminal domain-containing protein n=1 Tax=Catenuloplanes atrovinosus TaxID=137266 RepID=A0AAE3YM77_9ACTN|nr:hypothetical protein [Catenuloplanes atrovinosus]MDR7274891.1 hypothetical protein [Catenuloplanes atrovinosus]
MFRDRLEALARRGPVLAAAHPPREALVAWLGEIAAYVAAQRGIAVALFAYDDCADATDPCVMLVLDTARTLVAAAVEAGTVDPTVSAVDLFTLANGVAAVTEGDPDAAVRLITLATTGIGPGGR